MKALLLAAALSALTANQAAAAVIYSENFDGYTPSLNFAAFDAPGMVSEGTVDVVASGSFGINCASGAGNCLDLDGSTRNSGIFSFNVDLAPGDYVLSFVYGGNQRGGASDTLFLEIDLGGAIIALDELLAPSAGFERAEIFLPLVDAVSFAVRFSTDSNDNVGPILDSIRFELVEEVPEPAMLGLLGVGLLGLALARRRHV